MSLTPSERSERDEKIAEIEAIYRHYALVYAAFQIRKEHYDFLVSELRSSLAREAEAKKEIEAFTEIGVRKIEVVNGAVRMNLTLAQDMMKIIAGSALAMLDNVDAKNYLELHLGHASLPENGMVLMTIQRWLGKTPHQLRKDAEAERDALREQLLPALLPQETP